MKKKKNKLVIVLIIVAIILIVGAAFIFLRGDEDTWICAGGQWVKHGNPSAPMPTSDCIDSASVPQNGSQFITGQRQTAGGATIYTYSVKKIGLQFDSSYNEIPLRFDGNNMYVFGQLRPGVEYFDIGEGITELTLINNLINIFGKNPDNCRIATSSNPYAADASSTPGAVWLRVEPIKEYQPTAAETKDHLQKQYPSSTPQEIDNMIKNTPEGDWAKEAIMAQHTESDCGPYAKCYGYKCLSSFFYDKRNATQRVFYLYHLGGDVGFFSGDSISALRN